MSGYTLVFKDLLTKPEFRRLVKRVQAAVRGRVTDYSDSESESHALGYLVKLWLLADSHIASDDTLHMSAQEVDEFIGVAGIHQVLGPNWLEVLDADHVRLPNWLAHNGALAKKTARAKTRKEAWSRRRKERNLVARGTLERSARNGEGSHPALPIPTSYSESYSDSSPSLDSDSVVLPTAVAGAKFRARASRMAPRDWAPGEELLSAMHTECPAVDLERELRAFRDHTFGTARSDWNATFRNWVRKSSVALTPKLTRHEQAMAALRAADEDS